MKEEVRSYWERHPNAVHIAGDSKVGTKEFFQAIEQHRYAAEPCIQEMAEFSKWRGKLVLEIGCGIGTDLRQFAAAGAIVVGLDLTSQGIKTAKTGFDVFGLKGNFVIADAEALPFAADAFDLVYSNGVIHHTPDTQAAVLEIHRVLHPGGEARIMVYHRNSYFARIFVPFVLTPPIRVLLWLFPNGVLPESIARRLPGGVKNIYQIAAEKGFSRDVIFAASTDPSMPGASNSNPLSRSYSRREAASLFSTFKSFRCYVRQLYYAQFLPAKIHSWLERKAGWFLFVRASK